MAVDKIEQACITILSELKKGQYTKPELAMLYALFSKLAEITKKKLE